MSAFSPEFIEAFNEIMLHEVGPHWNPADPEVVAGLIDTSAQRRKVGYVNIPADRGGETKYGIAQAGNPRVRVRSLDLAQTMQVYHTDYWIRGRCDGLPPGVSLIHFDGCVNHGVGRAARFLQSAVGATPDGAIGARTLEAVNRQDPSSTINTIAGLRTKFYNDIVRSNPSQSIFLKGWMRRIAEVQHSADSKIKN